jgi:hypothetical protein
VVCTAATLLALCVARRRHAPAFQARCEHVHAGDGAHARQRQDAAAHFSLDREPARTQGRQPGNAGGKALPADIEREVALQICQQTTTRQHRLREAREQLFQHLAPARQQPVRVHRLRRAFAGSGVVRQGVAFEQDDFVEMLAEHARRQQASQTGAEHDGALGCGWVGSGRGVHHRGLLRR